jgi:hypothetical protein
LKEPFLFKTLQGYLLQKAEKRGGRSFVFRRGSTNGGHPASIDGLWGFGKGLGTASWNYTTYGMEVKNFSKSGSHHQLHQGHQERKNKNILPFLVP